MGSGFWQIGVLVQDLEGAMAEIGDAFGLTWSEPLDAEFDGTPLRVAMTREGPPYLEFIEAPAGSQWDASAGPRLDHLARWTEDFEDERERLEASGLPVVVDGRAVGRRMNYHALPKSGFRVELFDAADREGFKQRWDLQDVG